MVSLLYKFIGGIHGVDKVYEILTDKVQRARGLLCGNNFKNIRKIYINVMYLKLKYILNYSYKHTY